MAGRLLFLAHRLPYPPDKGDRIRSWHMLEYLSRRWEIDLGCLSDDPTDFDHLPKLRNYCADIRCEPVGSGLVPALRALWRARPGRPLTLGWFHSAALQGWVRERHAARRHDAIFAYSSAMAPFVMGLEPGARRVLDLVDVDSEKWLAYAAASRLPQRAVWAREARTLLAFERRAAAAFDHTILVSKEEAQRFVELAPETADRVDYVDNGVELARFDPAIDYPSPYDGAGPALVFTGTMDYRPNVEAVRWFAQQVMPLLRAMEWPAGAPQFHIVGARPNDAVRALAALPGVFVTGRVPDTRPYIAHAAAAVAPLQIARGIQNKVLESMALARPVVASPAAFEGVRAQPGRDLLVADGAEAWAATLRAVLLGHHPGIGAAGRVAVQRGHDWAATLRRLDPLLERRLVGAS